MYKINYISFVNILIYIQTKIIKPIFCKLNIFNSIIKLINVFGFKHLLKPKIEFNIINYIQYTYFNLIYNIVLFNKKSVVEYNYKKKVILNKYKNFTYNIICVYKILYKFLLCNVDNKKYLIYMYKLFTIFNINFFNYITYKNKQIHDKLLNSKNFIKILNIFTGNIFNKIIINTLTYIIKQKYITNILYFNNNLHNINYYIYSIYVFVRFIYITYNTFNISNIENIKSEILKKHIINFFIAYSTKEKHKNINNLIYKFNTTINKFIFGQSLVIKKLTTYLSNFTNYSKIKPIGSFLLCGPSGTGKTELVKLTTNYLYGSSKNLIQIDMSEYKEKHSISKLIGSPPGYKGYEEGGSLINKVNLLPNSVILFDEIEKANKDIFSIFLQILDEGVLTDSKGVSCRFNKSLIFFTSNLGSRLFNDSNNNEIVDSKYYNKVKFEVNNYFKSEFINRLNDIIIFNPLLKHNLYKLCDKHFYNNCTNNIFIDNIVKALICYSSCSTEQGSRFLINNLNRIINNINIFKNNNIVYKNMFIKYIIN